MAIASLGLEGFGGALALTWVRWRRSWLWRWAAHGKDVQVCSTSFAKHPGGGSLHLLNDRKNDLRALKGPSWHCVHKARLLHSS